MTLAMNRTAPGEEPPPNFAARVVRTYPHDSNAFCQGLIVDGAVLFEGTGHHGQSTLRRVTLETGKVEESRSLSDRYFGEGITQFGSRIYQLTWQSQICVVYERETFKPIGSLPYKGEGWGITDDEKVIYLSDGSSVIRILDPQSFKELRRITVMDGRRRVNQLNELEYVRGEIFANIWHSDRIARIDPATGTVTGWIDCSHLFPAYLRRDREDVLNGIAYDAKSEKLFLTGKNWPQLFEVEIVEAK